MTTAPVDTGAHPFGGEAGPKLHSENLDKFAMDLPTEVSWTGTAITRPPPAMAPSPRLIALGLALSPLPGASSLRLPSSPSTPSNAPGTPGTPGTPWTPGSPLSGSHDFSPNSGACTCSSPHGHSRPTSARALSLSIARRASAASLLSEDGIDITRLDLRPVYTPPPGTVPLPPLPGHAHPLPSPVLGGQSPVSVAAILPVNHQHRRTSTSSQGHSRSPSYCSHAHTHAHSHSHSASMCPSAAGSLQASPLLGPLLAAALPVVPPGPTLAETGLRLSTDVSHASGQLERKSPGPRLIRLDSFGGEGLEQKPSSRRGTGDGEIDEIEEGDDA